MLLGGDFNGHGSSDLCGFREVYGGFRIGQINDGGIKLLDQAIGKGFRLMNTYFRSRKSQLIIFRSGETETVIDFILVNKKYRGSAKDVKVFPGEEIVSQHCLLLMDMVFKTKVRGKYMLWIGNFGEMEKVDSCRDGRELSAKQRSGEKRNVVGVSCLKDKSGTVKVKVDDQKKI